MSWSTRGRRVTIPDPRGRKSLRGEKRDVKRRGDRRRKEIRR